VDYLTDQLITYLGNKRKLIGWIDHILNEIITTLGKPNPTIFDGFSGSGSTARLFKKYAQTLYVNDLEGYSERLNRCYLSNRSEHPEGINDHIDYLNGHKLDPQEKGIIETNYTPLDDTNIQPGERVFYTNQNAQIIDNIRRLINQVDPLLHDFLIAPLLVKASIHNNTSGVFKGFHKKDGIGHFGGAGENALARILKEITLEYPIFSDRECPTRVLRGDTNEIITQIGPIDIAYYDPPYNQHPYGSNYFMLNLINDYDDREIQQGVSGITVEWNKSLYNKRQEAEVALRDLIEKTPAKYTLISYNDEGIIDLDRFAEILFQYGDVELKDIAYHTYRGSKNLGKNKQTKDGQTRNLKVHELLWVLKR
jgi:adenine-specific DNA-methyltransferase